MSVRLQPVFEPQPGLLTVRRRAETAGSVPAFATDIRHLDGSAVVQLRGELDLSTVSILQQDLRSLTCRYDADQVTIDCDALEFIDAGGLGHLVHLAKAMRSGRIKIVNPPVSLRALLGVTGANAVFDVDPRVTAGSMA